MKCLYSAVHVPFLPRAACVEGAKSLNSYKFQLCLFDLVTAYSTSLRSLGDRRKKGKMECVKLACNSQLGIRFGGLLGNG